MLIGAHAILYSRNAEADRAFLQDVLRLPNVDVGGGWLIFALPASEVAVHPTDGEVKHELYLMCGDISDFIDVMKQHGIECGPVMHERWGLLTQLQLPGGGHLGVYEPRHPRPKPLSGRKLHRPAAKRGTARPRKRKLRRNPRKTSAGKKSR